MGLEDVITVILQLNTVKVKTSTCKFSRSSKGNKLKRGASSSIRVEREFMLPTEKSPSHPTIFKLGSS
jgi:flagellar basal body L-ring protein FlgH